MTFQPFSFSRLKVLAVLTVFLFLFTLVFRQTLILGFIERWVAREHPVPQINPLALGNLLSTHSQDVLLFDIRETAEYQVGHLKSAHHVSPETEPGEFMTAFGSEMQGKHVVFYCSVGYRSSRFLEAVANETEKAGVLSAANLKGGIFRWYNENYTVFKGEDETNKIHPYNSLWDVAVVGRSWFH